MSYLRITRIVALAMVVVPLAGCQSAGAGLLSLIGLSQKPLSVMYASEKAELPEVALAPLIDPFSASRKLHDALGKATSRTVASDLCFGFQVEPNLALGFCHLAVLTSVQYSNLNERAKYPVLVVAVDEKGRSRRSALLIVPAGSPIRTVADVKGKRVLFGPPRDGRAHHAALLLLKENGIAPTDLQLGVFPVVGSLRMLPKSRDIAQSVLANSNDAGFIDEQAWDDMPESDATEGVLARSKFRVIAKTIAVPEALILRSAKLDDATAEQVKAFFLAVGKENPEVLKPLHFSGYSVPSAEDLATCEKLRGAGVAMAQPAASSDPAGE